MSAYHLVLVGHFWKNLSLFTDNFTEVKNKKMLKVNIKYLNEHLNIANTGVPQWRSQLSIWLLVFAYVVVSQWWGRALSWAPCSEQSAWVSPSSNASSTPNKSLKKKIANTAFYAIFSWFWLYIYINEYRALNTTYCSSAVMHKHRLNSHKYW